MPNTAHVDLMEAVGPGPATEVVVLTPVLLGNDVHSTSSSAQHIRVARNGVPVYTFERWLRLRFTPPFGRVGAFRIWSTTSSLTDTWDVSFGITPNYATPTRSPSAYAYGPLPTADPGATNPNLGVEPIVADGFIYTPWIVLQGSLTGTDVDMTAQSVSFNFTWTES